MSSSTADGIRTVLSSSDEISSFFTSVLQDADYPAELCERYVSVLDRTFLLWKAALPPDRPAYASLRSTEKDLIFRIGIRAEPSNPFRLSGPADDPLHKLRESLLPDIGEEFRYRYRDGTNLLIITLPKKHVRETLFRRSLLSLALPITVQSAMETAATKLDALMLGFLSTSSMSAVSLVNSFYLIHSMIVGGCTVASIALLSQYRGKGDRDSAGSVASAALRIVLAVSILFAALSFLFPEQIMRFYTDIPEVIAEGVRYLRITAVNVLVTGVCMTGFCFLETAGKVRLCLGITVTGSVLNLILNYLFIFGRFGLPKLGITGAALATLTSSALQLILVLISLCRNAFYRLSVLGHIRSKFYRIFFRTSLPNVLQHLMWVIGISFVTSAIGHMGPAVVAAESALSVLGSFAVAACSGLGSGCGLLVARSLGRKDFGEALRQSRQTLRIGICIALGGAALFALAAYLLRFTSMQFDSETLRWMNLLIIVYTVSIICCHMNGIINNGALYSGGDAKAVLIIDSAVMWLVMVPLSLLVQYTGLLPAAPALVILKSSELLSFPAKYLRWRSKKWLRSIIDD